MTSAIKPETCLHSLIHSEARLHQKLWHVSPSFPSCSSTSSQLLFFGKIKSSSCFLSSLLYHYPTFNELLSHHSSAKWSFMDSKRSFQCRVLPLLCFFEDNWWDYGEEHHLNWKKAAVQTYLALCRYVKLPEINIKLHCFMFLQTWAVSRFFFVITTIFFNSIGFLHPTGFV